LIKQKYLSSFNFVYNDSRNNEIIQFNNYNDAKNFIISKLENYINELISEFTKICEYLNNQNLVDINNQIILMFQNLKEKHIIDNLEEGKMSMFESKIKEINSESQNLILSYNSNITKQIKDVDSKDNHDDSNCSNFMATGVAIICSAGLFIAYRKIQNRSILYYSKN